VKRMFTGLAVVVAIGMTGVLVAQGQTGGTTGGGTTASPRPQRIYIVNIAKVLRDYNKANFQGAEITKKRSDYVSQVNILRDQMAAKNAEFQKTQDPVMKKKLQEEALAINRQIEDIDRRAQEELTRLSNDTIVRVYQEVKGVIKEVAEANGIDMVLCYPAASKPEDENSPAVAQLMLQTPAMIPFYHRGMDISDVVVKTLNARYPSAAPVTAAGGTTGPMGTAPKPGGN
jgi:Skp family chaperone for outer membrane proteins